MKEAIAIPSFWLDICKIFVIKSISDAAF